MNVLILGSDGRSHALALTYGKSSRVKNIFVLPGNGLIDYKTRRTHIFPHIKVLDFPAILNVVKKNKIQLVDVAQDDPLAAGFVDEFEKRGIKAFGPTKLSAQLEWDKEWARKFMVKYKLPIPHFQSFTDAKKAIVYIKKLPEQLLYIKASGLALGKGALRAETKEQAIDAVHAMKQFGKAGETFLVEEGLVGEEFSLFAVCDGKNYIITKSSQDHKTVFNSDQGPNTGGMGCVAPAGVITSSIIRIIEQKIIRPTLLGMQKEERPYSGILYLGGMITKSGVRIIEFNARWGDPEAEVILPSIKTDYIDIVHAVTMKQLNNITIKFDNKVRVSVAACSKGYPNDYSTVKGKEIFGLTDVMKIKGITVFGAGIKRLGNRFFVNGGRVFHLVAEGKTIEEARRLAYGALSMIYIEGNNLHYRTDIGYRDVERGYDSKN